VQGFAPAGKDGVWKWVRVEISGDTMKVWSSEIPEPQKGRYAWSNNPTCNLYNQAGLPAGPFQVGIPER
jgi:sialate O-acetylesterase